MQKGDLWNILTSSGPDKVSLSHVSKHEDGQPAVNLDEPPAFPYDTCLPITSMLARRKCLLADLLLSASSRNAATPVATALRSRLFASVYAFRTAGMVRTKKKKGTCFLMLNTVEMHENLARTAFP